MGTNTYDCFKRYWVFEGECYYPGGGMNDFSGSFDTIVEAHDSFGDFDWHNILDSKTGELVG